MGYGDQLMATGMAKGAAARGVKIAFGDAGQIRWDHHSEAIFQHNPNIARPGSEGEPNLEWIKYYRGHRIYNRHDEKNRRWVWNYSFKATPGEITFNATELQFVAGLKPQFIMVEPNVPTWKPSASNKAWPFDRYMSVAKTLRKAGYEIRQLDSGLYKLPHVHLLKAPTFRHAMMVLSKAALYIGPEGGLHHAAAALGIPAVVLFGGWIPKQITGYDTHVNIQSTHKACGRLYACDHCVRAMRLITDKQVIEAAMGVLDGRAFGARPAPEGEGPPRLSV